MLLALMLPDRLGEEQNAGRARYLPAQVCWDERRFSLRVPCRGDTWVFRGVHTMRTQGVSSKRSSIPGV